MRNDIKSAVSDIIGRDSQGHSLHIAEISFDTCYIQQLNGVPYLIRRDESGAAHVVGPVCLQATQCRKEAQSAERPTSEAHPQRKVTNNWTKERAAPFVFDRLVRDGQLPPPIQNYPVWDGQALVEALQKLKRANSK